jgi:hypothetical protein
MAQVISATDLELHQVYEKFNLRPVWDDPQFFPEWQGEQVELTDYEKYWLDQIKADALSLMAHRFNEEVVKLSVLAPLLSLAKLNRFPFIPSAEHEVEIAFEDDGEIIRGKIDLLVLHQHLWAIVVEAKRHQLNVTEALPQALTYMMANPNGAYPIYGLILNGTEFLFLKLVQQDTPQYSISRLFSLLNPGNDLYKVWGILKYLSDAVRKWDDGRVG